MSTDLIRQTSIPGYWIRAVVEAFDWEVSQSSAWVLGDIPRSVLPLA